LLFNTQLWAWRIGRLPPHQRSPRFSFSTQVAPDPSQALSGKCDRHRPSGPRSPRSNVTTEKSGMDVRARGNLTRGEAPPQDAKRARALNPPPPQQMSGSAFSFVRNDTFPRNYLLLGLIGGRAGRLGHAMRRGPRALRRAFRATASPRPLTHCYATHCRLLHQALRAGAAHLTCP
jgi:hypothetical protein